MATLARELSSLAERATSKPGSGLAALILTDLALADGRLDEAEKHLLEAERNNDDAGAVAGGVLVLERRARLALAHGQKARAAELVERAMAVVDTTWLAPHLRIRFKALAVEIAPTLDRALHEVALGDRALAGGTSCQPCSMGFRTAAAIALAEAGELDQVGRRLDEAERIAAMWNGGPWAAAIWEARGVFRRAQGNESRAVAAFDEAAARYAELCRPLEQARCMKRMKEGTGPAAP
jgi:tetratricopeptide (TPR) repeat protein